MTKSGVDSDKERLQWTVALLQVPGIGKGRFSRLVRALGSAKTVFESSVSHLESVNGISRSIASEIISWNGFESARHIAATIIQLGWHVHYPDSPGYPSRLTQIDEAPPILFSLGNQLDTARPAVAIVGTRHPSESGKMFAHRLAHDLCRAGVTVVSGMAEGIDAAAHKGALDCQGTTIAVWGTPLNKVFPASHRLLAEQISQSGLIYSEYLPGTETMASNFPERNRIISGLCDAVVVVEAGARSGALITAEHALTQGRELFAVPGHPGAEKSMGANTLIKKGARLLTSVEDIFTELPRLKGEVKAVAFQAQPDLTEGEKKMVALLAQGPAQIDQLSRQSNLEVAELAEYLLALELKGVIQELSGKRFALVD